MEDILDSITMHNLLLLKQSQPPEWLSGSSGSVSLSVPNSVTVTLHGEDGNVSGVPLSFLAADSRLVRAMLLTHNEGEKHITLMSECETISYYVSLLCTGSLHLGEDR